jgi:hypothetical protein
MRPNIVRFFAFAASLFYIFLVCTLQLNAQTGTAQLSGLVTDSTGAVLPNASVLIVNRDTGVSRSVQTNAQGEYTAPALQPGHYRITVEAKGFKTLVTENVTLNVAQETNLRFQLKVGTETQSITVDGSGLQINTTDASVSTVIDQKFVENVPLNGRSFQDLISMTPGVVTQSPQNSGQVTGYSGDFSVNGQRTESNYYTVDGVSGNINAGDGNGAYGPASSGALAGATALGTTQSLISVDALQEFRVQSSTYSAQYGRVPGGQFSIATRSGQKYFHGSTFDYLRNNFFDANDWFNDYYGTPIPALRQNDFGGTLGGRIWIPKFYDGKDRSFFFISYEGLRLTQPQAAEIQYVPDSYSRQQAPTALQPILNAFPIQNALDYGTSSSPSLAEFIKSYSLPSTIDSTSLRLDHKFSAKLLAFFRMGYTPSSAATRALSVYTQRTANVQTYTFGITSTLSNRISNEFRCGYARSESSSISNLDSFGGASPIDLTASMAAGSYSYSEPVFQLYFPSIGSSQLAVNNAKNQGRQLNITDTFNSSIGNHWLHFGIDYLRMKSPTNGPSPIISALFLSPQTVLANAADEEFLVKILPATPVFNEFSAFAQDEWRIKPTLNVSLGIRWEVDPPPGEAHGNNAYTLSGDVANPESLVLAPQGTPLWKTSWYNIAPRLGVAWTANQRSGWETVLRGGGGVFFDTDDKEASQGFGGIGFDAYQILAGSPLPFTAAALDFSPSTTAPYSASTIYDFPTHLQLPYTLEWSTSLEQNMGKSQALTVSYIGSNGRRLIDYSENYLGSLNPDFGYVVFFHSGLTSNYQALQTKIQRSVSHGFQFLASYTWSHSIDFGSNDYVLPVTRGNSDFDVRHNFQGGLSWEIPTSAKITGLPGLLLNSWGLDARATARSGFPITLDGNYLLDPATGSMYYGNLDLVPDQPVYVFGSNYPGGRAINPAAFSYPSGTGTGDAPRNFVRGFGATQVNLAARRQVKLHGALSLQFRAETFNILNHPNFGYIDPNLGDATFGLATQMLNHSLATVASQYQQGGPRSMQFALKILF